MVKPDTLVSVFDEPADVAVLNDFQNLKEERLRELYDSLGLAMTFKIFCIFKNIFTTRKDVILP